MPVYEYRCGTCGHKLEAIQKFSDPPLTECPRCHGKLKKLISNTSFVLKGTGWYVTDYARKGHATPAQGHATPAQGQATQAQGGHATQAQGGHAARGDGAAGADKEKSRPAAGKSASEGQADKPAPKAEPRPEAGK